MRPATKRKLLIVGIGVGAFGLLCVTAVLITFTAIALPTNERDNANPARQKEMLAITLDVGRLAPIPKDASIKTIRTEGNSFTRTFIVEFSADAHAIDEWLVSSKSIKTAKTEQTDHGLKYILDPKKGWQWAEVTVNQTTNTVYIRVEWS